MRSLKQLRDELGFAQECHILFDAMQQTALSQWTRIMQARQSMLPVAPTMEQWCLPLIPTAAASHSLLRSRRAGTLLIVMTGDQGLVGPLYHDVIRTALAQAREPSQWIALGVRGSALLTERDIAHQTVPSPLEEEAPSLMTRLATQIVQRLSEEPISHVWLAFSRFESMTRQVAVAQPLLPLPARSATVPEDLVLEPSTERVIERVVWAWLRAWLEDAWWTNRLAELAARVLHLEEAREDLTTQTNTLRRDCFKAIHERLDTMTRELGAARSCR